MNVRRGLAGALCALATTAAAHAAASNAELQAKLESMEQELKQVNAANSEFQRRQEILTVEIRKVRESMVLPEEPKLKSTYGMGPAASKVYGIQRGLSIGGYGNGFYTNLGQDKGINDHNRFDIQRVVLYTGYKFSDHLVFNSELEVEHANTDDGGEVGVEFAQLDYLHTPKLNFRFGLMLIPMGIINELHEPLFFHGNQRPEVETQIIPSTWRENGVGIFGALSSKVNYRAYVVASGKASGFTSASIEGGKQEGANAIADDLSTVGRLEYQATNQLQIAGSVYNGRQGQRENFEVKPGTFVRVGARTTVSEAHAIYRNRGLEARALVTGIHIDDADALSAAAAVKGLGPIASHLDGWYAELAYDLFSQRKGGSGASLAPFARFEKFDTQDRVPLGFIPDRTRDVILRTFGIDYKPYPQVVFKLDHRDFSIGGGATRADETNVGFGYIF